MFGVNGTLVSQRFADLLGLPATSLESLHIKVSSTGMVFGGLEHVLLTVILLSVALLVPNAYQLLDLSYLPGDQAQGRRSMPLLFRPGWPNAVLVGLAAAIAMFFMLGHSTEFLYFQF